MNTVFEKITYYNRNRNAVFVQWKYRLLAESVFRFFRGTCHLFFEDLARNISWKDDTKCWICGDLHLENFGSYKGDNRVVYFDMNDFDEAILAPATWEISRMLTSIYLGAKTLSLPLRTANALADTFLDTYIITLQNGKPKVIEKETAKGLLKELLLTVRDRSERRFIAERTLKEDNLRKLKAVKGKVVLLKDGERKPIQTAIKELFRKDALLKKFRLIDIAHRIAGTGSVGLDRYVVLVQKKIGDDYRLIDIKEATASSLAPYVKLQQPAWPDEATRIISLQKRLQHVSPALLHPVQLNTKYFVLKELQPTQDRMDLALCNGDIEKLRNIIKTMATITASAQLRATGRQGSSIADALISFAAGGEWRAPVLAYASSYAKLVNTQYKEYCKAYAQTLS